MSTRDRRNIEIAPKITDPDAEEATSQGLLRGVLDTLLSGITATIDEIQQAVEVVPGDGQSEEIVAPEITVEDTFVFDAVGRPVFMGSIEASGDDATVTIEEAPSIFADEKHWHEVNAGPATATDGTTESYRYDLSGTGLRVTIDPGTGTADFEGVVS